MEADRPHSEAATSEAGARCEVGATGAAAVLEKR